ncbi:MAG: Crp/Fnr family transcriptional regulator [Nitrospinota bacterium]
MQPKRYKRGDSIFLDGDKSDHIFAIRSGLIKTFMTTGAGKEQIFNLVVPGNFMGLEATYSDSYSFSAAAITKSEVCFARKEKLLSLLRNNSDMAIEVLKILAAELRQARNQIKDLGLKSARQRVASFLLLPPFFLNFGKKEDRLLNLPLTRQEISELLGLTMETVSRVLSQFQDEGLIKVNRSNIEFLDFQQLFILSE